MPCQSRQEYHLKSIKDEDLLCSKRGQYFSFLPTTLSNALILFIVHKKGTYLKYLLRFEHDILITLISSLVVN